MKPNEFVSRVIELYTQGKSVFEKKINAEELIPKDLNPLNKASYIFYVLQLDYAMKSQILYQGAIKLYKTIPDFFTPKSISKLSKEDLTKYLKEYIHPRYINEAVKRYLLNTEQILKSCNGDPRKIFDDTTFCYDVLKRLKDFRGFGPKIGTFFVRTMINTFNYDFKDIDTILPPVDIHDVRIGFLLGYTKTDKMTQSNINFVKNLWRDACVNSENSWLIFDKALWLLGSEGKPKSKAGLLKLLEV